MHVEELFDQAQKPDSTAGMTRFLIGHFLPVVHKILPEGSRFCRFITHILLASRRAHSAMGSSCKSPLQPFFQLYSTYSTSRKDMTRPCISWTELGSEAGKRLSQGFEDQGLQVGVERPACVRTSRVVLLRSSGHRTVGPTRNGRSCQNSDSQETQCNELRQLVDAQVQAELKEKDEGQYAR